MSLSWGAVMLGQRQPWHRHGWGRLRFSSPPKSRQLHECRAIRQSAVSPRVTSSTKLTLLAAKWDETPMQPPFSQRHSILAADLPSGPPEPSAQKPNTQTVCKASSQIRKISPFLRILPHGLKQETMDAEKSPAPALQPSTTVQSTRRLSSLHQEPVFAAEFGLVKSVRKAAETADQPSTSSQIHSQDSVLLLFVSKLEHHHALQPTHATSPFAPDKTVKFRTLCSTWNIQIVFL